MIKTKTIRINEDVHYTAQQTESKKFRSGFSEYVENLISDDLKRKNIAIVKKP
jgi:predicted CopG family antitoxin